MPLKGKGYQFQAAPRKIGLHKAKKSLSFLRGRHGIEALAQKLSGNPDCLTNELGLDVDYVAFLRQQYRIQQAHIALMANFVPGRINAPLHVFRAEDSVRQGASEMDWLAHIHAIRHSTQHTLPGHHENLILLEENIDAIVQVLAC